MNIQAEVQRLAELYHRKVYTRLSGAISKRTDSVEQALTDEALPLVPYAPAAMVLLILVELITVYRTVIDADTATQVKEILHSIFAILSPLAVVIISALSVYGINYFRKPFPEKLGLQLEKFDAEEEFRFLVEKLNALKNSPSLPENDFVQHANESGDHLFDTVDGYTTPTSRKIKHTRHTKLMMRQMNAVGLYNLWIQECVIADPHYLRTYPHERAHGKGLPQEAYAELAGILTFVTSDHPSVQYVGYQNWLDNLLPALYERWDFPRRRVEFSQVKHQFQKAGLNERTIEEFRELFAFDDTMLKNLSPFTKFMQRKSRDMLLKILGQEDEMTAYRKHPLQYLHSYRRQFLSEEVR